MPNRNSCTRPALARWTGLTGLVLAASMLGACAQSGNGLDGGAAALLASHQPKGDEQPRDDLGRALAYWGKEYQKHPRSKKAALAYAKNLKAAGQHKQALAVLRYASTYHGNDRDISAEFGRLALAAGQVQLAQKLLAIADDPSNPDWRIVMGRGTAMAQQGQYKAAIPFFERALHLAPSNPTALSNLAMAHAGAGDLPKAEGLLQKAMAMPTAKPVIRKNLAMVLKLMGRKADATRVASGAQLPFRSTVGTPKPKPFGNAVAAVN